MNSIELFAGGGGLALGVSNAGFSHSLMVEWDSCSTRTLHANSNNFKLTGDSGGCLFCGDVRDLDFRQYEGSVDLLSGGPPCQPFSIGGKAQAYNDKRDMFPEAARALAEIRPRAFIFENVKGLLRKSFADYFEYIILQLTYPTIVRRSDEAWVSHLGRLEAHHTDAHRVDDLVYNVVFRLVNAADYGIPQKRERVFIVGFRNDISARYSFPEATHSRQALVYEQYVTGEYWERHGLPRPKMKTGEGVLALDSYQKPWVTVRDAFVGLSVDDGRQVVSVKGKVYTGHTGSNLDEPSKTIKAGAHGVPGGENMYIDDSGQARHFSVREAARIQTFPDNYLFPCSWTEAMRQIGNAVPVKLANIVAGSVKKMLNGNF